MRVGCGAGFGGDRPNAAVRLLERVEGLDYIVLECLAERTLADRYQIMMEGGVGYDHRSTISRVNSIISVLYSTVHFNQISLFSKAYLLSIK